MVAEPSSGITTSSVISFTPRQVLLQNRNMKQRSSLVVMENDSEVKTQKAEKKKRKELRKIGLLMQSIAAFLDRKGLSRTLSSLQSEASIEVDCWKTNSFDLEDMYSKFCIASESPATAITDNSKEQDSTKDEISKDDGEKDHKKKRKNTVGKDSENGTKSSITDGEIHQLDMNNGSCDMEGVGTEFKEEKKKKKKRSSDSLGDGIEHTAADKGSLNNKKDSDEPSAKSKDKKKKGKSIPDSENVEQYPNRERLMDEVNKLDSELPQSISDGVELDGTTLKSKNKKKRKHETETDVDMKNEENGVNVKKKEQKKRKRSESEEQDYLNDDHVVDKEKAVKKADGLEDMKAIEKPAKDSQSQSTDGNSKPNKKRKTVRREEDSKRDDDANIDSKQVLQEGKEKPGVDSVVVDNGTSGPTPKTTKKETTAEPRTAKAFRRVNVNEVEFVDERLQDNSYWAKDGAETGYGAKAQEVLGQVRGRDFRHEKTKKKRGSYRGGQIDLQSHSIKFNYSDDD